MSRRRLDGQLRTKRVQSWSESRDAETKDAETKESESSEGMQRLRALGSGVYVRVAAHQESVHERHDIIVELLRRCLARLSWVSE